MKAFTLQIPAEAINTILSGLGKLPAETSFDLINDIHKQVDEQLKAEEKKKEEEKETAFQERLKKHLETPKQ